MQYLVGLDIIGHLKFQFGVFCRTSHHSNTYKLLQNSPFFWDTLQFRANLVILKISISISDSDIFYQSIKLINSTANQKTAIYPLQISISFLSQTLFINVYASSSVIEFNFLISVQIWPINPCCISFPKSLIGSFVVNSFSAQQREKIRLIIRKL